MDNDIISTEVIKAHIYELRGHRIMIDSDLASLYRIETKNLKRAVRMNIERFPDDFMFELTREEYESLRCNFFTLKEGGRGKHSKYLPFAFTQEGIAMLSGLLMPQREDYMIMDDQYFSFEATSKIFSVKDLLKC